MVMITAKLNKRKMCLVLILLILAGVTMALLLKNSTEPSTEEASQPSIDTNEGRIAYLEQAGYTVDAAAVKEHSVSIPDSPDEVFDRYNELQKSQGFDLSQLAGKTVERYVYRIVDNDADTRYATLLVYDGAVVGADVTSCSPGGKMQALLQPAHSQSASM